MSGDSLRVGIIGLGGMGHQHMRACSIIADMDVVAGCDVLPSQLDRWRRTFPDQPVQLFRSMEQMINSVALDAVIVATHAEQHAEQTLLAFEHGIHVLCEKPLAINLREADAMVTAANDQGLRFAVNHIKRGSLGTARALDLIAEGLIGEPYLIRGEGKGKRWAASELMEMGTHLFDWLRALAGNVSYLYADVRQDGREVTRNDIVPSRELPYPEKDVGLVLGQRAFCSLGMQDGLHADVGFLFQPDIDDEGYGFDICGTEGTLALRRSVGTQLFFQAGPHRGPLTHHSWQALPLDECTGIPEETGVARAADRNARLACQYRLSNDFAAAIRGRRDPMSSGEDGRDALELVMAVWESARTRGPVRLPLAQREHPLEVWRRDAIAPD